MVCVLGQHDKTGKKKQAIYYLSNHFIDYKTRYTPLEKTCLSLVYVTKRLRHHFLSYKVFLISWINPIKCLFEKPATIRRTAQWLMMLSEFDIIYVSQKAIKGQAIADFLADAPSSLKFDFSYEHRLCVEVESSNIVNWKMCFDGAVNQLGYGIKVMLIFPTGVLILITARLHFRMHQQHSQVWSLHYRFENSHWSWHWWTRSLRRFNTCHFPSYRRLVHLRREILRLPWMSTDPVQELWISNFWPCWQKKE